MAGSVSVMGMKKTFLADFSQPSEPGLHQVVVTGEQEQEYPGYVSARTTWLRRVAYLLTHDWDSADELVRATITRPNHPPKWTPRLAGSSTGPPQPRATCPCAGSAPEGHDQKPVGSRGV